MNWQKKQELKELRRVGIIALDRDDHNGLRGSAARQAVALRIYRRHADVGTGRRCRSRALHPAAPPRHRQLRRRSGVRLLPDRPGADFNDVVIEMLERTP